MRRRIAFKGISGSIASSKDRPDVLQIAKIGVVSLSSDDGSAKRLVQLLIVIVLSSKMIKTDRIPINVSTTIFSKRHKNIRM